MAIPTGATFTMDISSTILNPTGSVTPTYPSGSKSITVVLDDVVNLNTGGGHTPLLVKATSGVVAPYVTGDLATFYEACFVQTNTASALISIDTTMLTINAYTGTNIAPNSVCDDGANKGPIFVKLAFSDRPPALSTDNYTLEITSEVDQLLGITSDVPAYLK